MAILKHQNYDDIKSHRNIISYDLMDAVDKELTTEHAREPGMEYAKSIFPDTRRLSVPTRTGIIALGTSVRILCKQQCAQI